MTNILNLLFVFVQQWVMFFQFLPKVVYLYFFGWIQTTQFRWNSKKHLFLLVLFYESKMFNCTLSGTHIFFNIKFISKYFSYFDKSSIFSIFRSLHDFTLKIENHTNDMKHWNMITLNYFSHGHRFHRF